MKDLLAQMVLNKNHGKGQVKEKPKCRRNPNFDEHSERVFVSAPQTSVESSVFKL